MTSSLYAPDTPLREKGKSYGKPFPIRWWYNEYIPFRQKHSLEHIFYDRTGSAKWRQDTVYKDSLDIINHFAPILNGGEND